MRKNQIAANKNQKYFLTILKKFVHSKYKIVNNSLYI